MSINILSQDLINQIAAGEVIENPSAVIKELIENSIDANATQIEIDLEDSGFKKISINDNGIGISKEDLLKAPLRHATSKIKSFNDLYSINTMGFRGEALASIFSISKAKIISKHNKAEEYYEITSENTNEAKPSASKNSTTIIITDIFYNTPARKKYLKSQTLELKAILDIVNRFEIYYNQVKITVKNNGKILVNKPTFSEKENNLIYVLGKDLKGKLIKFEEEMNGIKISGFIANPSELTYSYKKNQYLYVNSRFVKSKLINDAIYSGFTTNLMTGRHPFYTLFIDIDPEIIDVNVHPTKIEIRFENELEIYEFVKTTIEKQFQKNLNFKEFTPREYNQDLSEKIGEIKPYNNSINQSSDSSSDKHTSKYYTPEKQTNFEIKETIQTSTGVKENVIEYNKTEKIKLPISTPDSSVPEKGVLWDELLDYKILGQLNKTYILLETPKEFLLVDQHVCEEKYYFEKFKNQLENKKSFGSQVLLKAEIIHLTNSEMLMYKENKEIIDLIGFETEVFGNNEILIRKIPINIRAELVHADKIKDYLYEILINKKIKCVEEEKYSKIASMACRISVMAGDELTMPQMKRMIENLRTLKQPFNCPHGRPTFLRYNYYELEKKFKRIV